MYGSEGLEHAGTDASSQGEASGRHAMLHAKTCMQQTGQKRASTAIPWALLAGQGEGTTQPLVLFIVSNDAGKHFPHLPLD